MKAPLPILFSAVVASCLLVGCTADAPVGTRDRAGNLYAWTDDGGPGDFAVRINLSRQRAYFTRDGRLVGWSYIATGRDGHNTPAGTYRVSEKIVDKVSNRYGWIENAYGRTIEHDASPGDPVPPGGRYVPAPMPYWMRLTATGIGMHAGIIPRPGTPVSHGCIRLPKPLAPKVYEAVQVGTRVVIEDGAADAWEVHPAPLPEDDPTRERRVNGLRVVSPDDPWIVWPAGRDPRGGDGG